MWWILGIVVVVAAAGFVVEWRRPVVDRGRAPGRYTRLPMGDVHYEWGGPVRGPVIVAIHGLLRPSTVWNDVADELGRLGYRVLVYDLPGRGWSPAPGGRVDHVRLLEAFLADRGLDEDVTLLGYSMGGAIATAYAAAHPEAMKRLILVAPAGVEMREARFDRFVRTVPGLGDWLVRVAGPVLARRRGGSDGDGRRGYWPSVLADRRGILADRQEAEHRKIARDGVPVLAVWGAEDAVVPISALGTFTQWNRGAFQEMVAGAGHALTVTHPAQVAAAMREMLRDG